MATSYEHEEIVKRLRVMIHGLISSGVIPCSERDIIEGRLPFEKDQLFLNFGINLRMAITCFPLDPIIPLVKIDSYYDVGNNPDEFILNLSEEQDPMVIDKDEFLPSSSETQVPMVLVKFQDFDSDSDDDFEDDAKNADIKEDAMEQESSADDPDSEYYFKANDVIEEDMEADSGGDKENQAPLKSTTRVKKCLQCKTDFDTHEEYLIHKNEHVFSEIYGLRCKKKENDGYVSYMSHKILLQKKEELKNHFEIQIPPPDFTRDDLNKCVFEKPLQEYIVSDMATKWTECSNGLKKCSACSLRIKDLDALIKHYIKCHYLQFKCPHKGCDFKYVGHFYKFAKHVLYHTEPLPQLSVQHQCIACNFSHAYIDRVESHIKTMGKFHNSKCPRCPEKFSSRSDYLAHVTSQKHEVSVCGHCGETFEHENKLLPHKPICPNRPGKDVESICAICGKFVQTGSMKRHIETKHSKEHPTKCDLCDKICRSEEHLKHHMPECTKNGANSKSLRLPCPICGKMISASHMKNHNITRHTEEHLKPFVCTECPNLKGFRFKQQYEIHMNIHRGIRPYACKYCKKAFTDKANMRMHERSSHEGYKRK